MSLDVPVLLQKMAVNDWFASLPLQLREAMVNRSMLLQLGSAELLFRQGESARAWYGLVSGVVRLSSLREDGKEHIMSQMEIGTWTGESALIVDQPYLNNATALGPVTALALPRDAFNELMLNADFARAVAELVTMRLRLLYKGLGSTSLHSTRARIAQRLLLLARGDAAARSDVKQQIPVSQEALAMMLGITRQTLSAELKILAGQGIIRLGYRCIEIISEEALRLAGDATKP